MKADNIVKIEIDNADRLRVYPASENFEYIYRSGMEVHWDNGGFLYSPKPREWSYFDWYRQIVAAAKDEYGVSLFVTDNTEFKNILESLKRQILKYQF